jgi:hypothetical protein
METGGESLRDAGHGGEMARKDRLDARAEFTTPALSPKL